MQTVNILYIKKKNVYTVADLKWQVWNYMERKERGKKSYLQNGLLSLDILEEMIRLIY